MKHVRNPVQSQPPSICKGSNGFVRHCNLVQECLLLLSNRYPVFPVLDVALMKPEKLSLHAQSAMTPPVSPVARRTRAERHQSVLVT